MSGNLPLDGKKLNRMKKEILKLEKENLKTRKTTNDDLVEAIKKIIVNEVGKTY